MAFKDPDHLDQCSDHDDLCDLRTGEGPCDCYAARIFELKLENRSLAAHLKDLIDVIDIDHHLTRGGVARHDGHHTCKVCAIIERGRPKVKVGEKVQLRWCPGCGHNQIEPVCKVCGGATQLPLTERN